MKQASARSAVRGGVGLSTKRLARSLGTLAWGGLGAGCIAMAAVACGGGAAPHGSASQDGSGPEGEAGTGVEIDSGSVRPSEAGPTDAGTRGSACTAVKDFRATATTATTVALAWQGAPGVAITVSRKSYCGTDDYVVLAKLPPGSHTYTDTTPNASWVYWYEIEADRGATSARAAIGAQASTTPVAGCSGGATPQSSGVTGETCSAPTDSGTIPPPDASGPPSCAPTALDVKTMGAAGDGSTDDTAALQAAITGAGATRQVLFSKGTYRVTSSLNLPAGASLCGSGSPVITSASAGYLLQSPASNVTVTGLTLDGGGIELTSSGTQAGWQILYDTFQNITNGNDGVHVDNILGEGAASSISHNVFKNIWGVTGGYPNLPAGKTPLTCDTECIYGGGIFWHMGLDNTTIDDNTLDEIGYDAIKGFWDGFVGHTDPYEGHDVVISNNVMTHVHRMGIEVQAAGQGNCPGGCNDSLPPTDGTVIKNNFFSQPAFTWNVFAFSLMTGSTHGQLINNTGNNDVGTCYERAGIGLENSLNGGIVQGNVIGSVPQSCYPTGWADFVACGYTDATYTNQYQNNVFCGPGAAGQGSVNVGEDPSDNATQVETADLWSDTCAGTPDISVSNVALSFTSPADQSFPGGGNGTFKVGVVSNLSLKSVEFFVDGDKAPVVTQELGDVNSTFVSDRTWRYHATFDTSPLSAGKHTLLAVATDVSKASQSVSQDFTR